MFHFIGQLIGGLIVGIIARLILPGREALPDGALGWLVTAIIGIVGALIGGFIASRVWQGNDAGGWIMSILGAVLLLVVIRMIFGRSTSNV